MPSADTIRGYLEAEVQAITSAPLLFCVALTIIVLLIRWYYIGEYKDRIDDLEGRIKLKDDVIANLQHQQSKEREQNTGVVSAFLLPIEPPPSQSTPRPLHEEKITHHEIVHADHAAKYYTKVSTDSSVFPPPQPPPDKNKKDT